MYRATTSDLNFFSIRHTFFLFSTEKFRSKWEKVSGYAAELQTTVKSPEQRSEKTRPSPSSVHVVQLSVSAIFSQSYDLETIPKNQLFYELNLGIFLVA